MSIHQMSVNHEERQDRLLWRLNTLEGHEFKFWLTRRMLTRLLPALNEVLLKIHATNPALAASDTASLQMIRDFRREDMLTRADFKTPYAATAKKQPLGHEPLLLTEAHLTFVSPGSLSLLLEQKTEGDTKSCRLNLSTELVEGLLMLVQQALKSADWGLADVRREAQASAQRTEGTLSNLPDYKH